jgi:hypothetical protein
MNWSMRTRLIHTRNQFDCYDGQLCVIIEVHAHDRPVKFFDSDLLHVGNDSHLLVFVLYFAVLTIGDVTAS